MPTCMLIVKLIDDNARRLAAVKFLVLHLPGRLLINPCSSLRHTCVVVPFGGAPGAAAASCSRFFSLASISRNRAARFGLDIRKQLFKASLTRASVSCRDVSDVSCALDRSFSLHFEFLVCNVVTPRMGRDPQNGWGGVIVTGSQFFVALRGW